MRLNTTPRPARTLIPSIPGGLARHWRVQIQPDGQAEWRMFAAFCRPELADACLDDLQTRGIPARVVAVRNMPTAA